MKQIFPLIRSKVRKKIFSLLFTNPQKKYYFRELQRLIGGSPGSLLRELNYLVEGGILEDEFRGNLRFFRVNKNHPLFPELKSIVLKTEGIVGKIKDSFLKEPKIKAAFIYGSFAQGDETSASDVDLMIVGEPDLTNLRRRIKRLENWFGREINYSVYSSKEFIQKKKKSDFVNYILAEPKIVLVGKINED